MNPEDIEAPEPTPVEPLAELPPVSDDTTNHSVHIRDLRRRVRKIEESRPHFVREVQRMIANGFSILHSNLEAKWKLLDQVSAMTNEQTVLLVYIKVVVRIIAVLVAFVGFIAAVFEIYSIATKK